MPSSTGELYGVEVVAEGLAEGEGVLFYSLQQLLVVLGGVENVAVLVRAARVVGHDADFGLADDVAAEVLLEVDCGLQGHAEIAGLCRRRGRTRRGCGRGRRRASRRRRGV